MEWRVTVLCENTVPVPGLIGEHGFAALIESPNGTILFDTGQGFGLIANANRLKKDLKQVDKLVLSHGHFDHGDGLQYVDGNTLVCHPGCFVKRYRKEGGVNLGLALTKKEIERKFKLKTSRDPLRLSEHLYFLGEIPRVNDFEAISTRYMLEGGEEDHVIDDSGLACITDKGLVVVSGCAHSGICNIIEHAKKVTGMEQVEAVIGGFHLGAIDRQTKKTIQYMNDHKIPGLFPSHCTRDPALKMFKEVLGSREVVVGVERIWK